MTGAAKPVKRSVWYAAVRSIVRNGFFQTMGGLKTVGEENIPLEGGLIFAPNHMSHLDPPIVACAQNRRQLTFMAKEGLFKVPILGPIIRSLGAFPVRRGESDTESIRRAMGLLEDGRAVLIFPEGTRGDGATFQSINRGVAMLAKRTGAYVLPVGIVGTHLVLPRGRSMPRRHRMTVSFGKPFRYEEVGPDLGEKERRDAFARRLSGDIVSLCEKAGLELKIATETELRAEVSSQ